MSTTEWDKIGYELGWDTAHYGRKLPEKADKACSDGYQSFQHGGRRHVVGASVFEGKWLQVRMNAYGRKKAFDDLVTPRYLEGLLPGNLRCPVTKEVMTFGEMELSDWSIERADNNQGYVPGNLIVISTRANKAKSDHSLDALFEFAEGKVSNDGLSQREWQRLVELVHPMTPDEQGQVPGVQLLMGQAVASGQPGTNVMQLQSYLSQAVIANREEENRESGLFLVDLIYGSLCQSKVERRHFRALMKAMIKRSRTTKDESEIWATKRVQRLLFALLSELGGDSKRRLDETLNVIEGYANYLRDEFGPREVYQQCKDESARDAMRARA